MTGDDVGGTPNDESDRQYHLDLRPGEVADAVLLPGDPDRIDAVVEAWDEATAVARHREYRTATGRYEGTPISVTSTGIGSPSAAIAVEELARVGADTLIRVGSCGAVGGASVGDLVITSGAVRGEGTSDEYVREDYPAVADGEVVSALVAAAERLGYDYRVGVTLSADGFYAGQAREGYGGYRAPGSEDLLDDLRAANVENVEMEASAILTLAGLYGLRAGAVCTVFADRETDEFRVAGEGRAAACASLAVHLLSRMDEAKREAGADRWHAGLSL
ncbi:MAG: nucleoside phosphorylase [Haloferacaceae archaeon]